MTERILKDIGEMAGISSNGFITVGPDTTIGDLIEEGMDQFDFLNIMIAIEILHNVEIPDELFEDPATNFRDLAGRIADLPHRNDRYWVLDRLGMVSSLVVQCFNEASSAIAEEDDSPLFIP
ncbi:MAG: hypothetical protein QUS11_03990 [Candidatus Fermentibacter sp.]|nr:hypothetical protein [Candidatus Fermentibacter sp.]